MNLDAIRNALQVAPISNNYPEANTLRGNYGTTESNAKTKEVKTRKPGGVAAPGASLLNSWGVGELPAVSRPNTEIRRPYAGYAPVDPNKYNTEAEVRPTQPTESTESAESTETKAEPDTVQYTYKQGDTFGQVLLDLGLSKPGQLWGPDGDVAYYTQQLHEQGIYGNVPIGKTITLVPRTKATEVEFPSYLFNN